MTENGNTMDTLRSLSPPKKNYHHDNLLGSNRGRGEKKKRKIDTCVYVFKCKPQDLHLYHTHTAQDVRNLYIISKT